MIHTVTEVLKRTGISYRQLDYWCRIGVVRPTIGANGSGSKRIFSDEDIKDIELLGLLSDEFHGRVPNLERWVPIIHARRTYGDKADYLVFNDDHVMAVKAKELGEVLSFRDASVSIVIRLSSSR